MPSPEEQRTLTQFRILRDMQLKGMSKQDQDAWQAQVDDMEKAYTDAIAQAKPDKVVKDSADAVAKALPSLVKGIYSAQDAFAKGDYITGSAAIMDIAASVLPIFTAISSTAGPVGVLVGAVFSLVGQILSFFTPKQPSLESKIQKMLDHLQSEQHIEQITAFGTTVSIYTDSLHRTARRLPTVLSLPLTTEAEADTFRNGMNVVIDSLEMSNGRLSTPVFASWAVAAYLTRKENWTKEGWPEVLGLWCQTYTDLLSANLTIGCLVSDGTLEERLIRLKSLAEALSESWQSDNAQVLKTLEKLRPVARRRGVYAHLGHRSNGLVLFLAQGDGRTGALPWEMQRNTAWLERISVNLPASQTDSFTPVHELFAVEHSPTRIYRHTLAADTLAFSDGTVVVEPQEGKAFSDVCAITVAPETIGLPTGQAAQTYLSVVAQKSGEPARLNAYTLDAKGKSTRGDWQPEFPGAHDVRALSLTASASPDDPDGSAFDDATATPRGPDLTGGRTAVQYVGVRGANHLYVLGLDSRRQVTGPKNWDGYGHNGIEVDAGYLWVYGRGGIACVSHASMVRCLQGTRDDPAWIYHDFDRTAFPRRPEVTSLFPASDGTLLVGTTDDIYTADYTIDRQAMRVVTSSWTARGGRATQVVKLPIAGWPVLEHLHDALTEAAKATKA